MTYKDGSNSYNYYSSNWKLIDDLYFPIIGSLTNAVASGIVSSVNISGGVETNVLELKTPFFSSYATDQDFALIDVSGGTTGQQNGNAGILTYSPQLEDWKINLATLPDFIFTTVSDPVYLIGSAPSGFGLGNMRGGLSGDATTAGKSTDFGIYSYTPNEVSDQLFSAAPDLIAHIVGISLYDFLGENNPTPYTVTVSGTTFTVDGESAINSLGGVRQTITHSNNNTPSVSESGTPNYSITSNWYSTVKALNESGTTPLTPSGPYGVSDISVDISTGNQDGRSDVHNFLGMGAFYKLVDITGGITNNYSPHVNLV
jgi:hypothetical protein